jgi:hypothetical protein
VAPPTRRDFTSTEGFTFSSAAESTSSAASPWRLVFSAMRSIAP